MRTRRLGIMRELRKRFGRGMWRWGGRGCRGPAFARTARGMEVVEPPGEFPAPAISLRANTGSFDSYFAQDDRVGVVTADRRRRHEGITAAVSENERDCGGRSGDASLCMGAPIN